MPVNVNTMNVKILLSSDPKVRSVLDVEDNGQNIVHKNKDGTKIIWILAEPHAEFAGMDGTDPAFEWLEDPPAGLFGPATVTNNGNHLELMDYNDGTHPASEWIYKLRVIKDKTIYATTSKYDRKGAASKDPVIINKDP